jgi:hypothetical protein
MNAGFPVFLLSLFCCLLQSAKEYKRLNLGKKRQIQANQAFPYLMCIS